MKGRRIFIVGLAFLILIPVKVLGQENTYLKKIRFQGNVTFNRETLMKQINTTPKPFQEKIAFWKEDPVFSSFTLDEDILRLKKFYQQNGFLDVKISYELTPAKKEDKIKVMIRIKENDAISFGNFDLSYAEGAEKPVLLDSLKHTLPIISGTRFRDDLVVSAEQKIKSVLSSKGYPYVELQRKIVLNEKAKAADLGIHISPGNLSYFGKISLSGDTLIPNSFIKEHIELDQGEVFSNARLQETQKDLYDLALFRYVTIRALLDSVSDSSIPIDIQVRELPRWALKAGLGYGTEDRIRISAQLTRISFLGGARSLLIKGRHSYFIPLNIETKFIQPDVIYKDLDFILNPFFSREREESYEVDRWGIATSFQKKFNRNLNSFISYSFGKDLVDLSDSSSVEPNLNPGSFTPNKSAITTGASWNRTDNLFYPTKGFKISGMITYMGVGFNTQYNYIKIRTDISCYYPISSKLVLAGKLNSGNINAIRGNLSTPIEDRFLMGGASSLRGWPRNQISPVNAAGIKIGGNSLVEGSLELRFPLYGMFSGTAFVDVGNTWQDSWEFDFSNLLYDAGLGLRIKTPVGPIRLDLASPLFYEKFHVQFFITIGQAF